MLDSSSDSTLAVFSMHREIKLAKEHADKKDKSAFKACLRNCQTEAISFFQSNPEKVNAFASEMRAIYNAFKSNKKKDTNDLLDEQLGRCESAIKQITFEACLAHGTEHTPIRRLMELYELTMQSLNTSERMQILKGLMLSVEEKDGLGHMSLSVFLTTESDYEIISTAAMSLAVLFPVRDGDELSGPKYVANTLLNYEDNPKEQGAQLAGLILLGDKRVLPILKDTWQKISPTAQLEATRAKSSYMTESAIDFWLWCIENCDNENIVGSAVATLAKMPSIAAAPFVFESERVFPSYSAPEAPIQILNKTPLTDYLKKIDPHLKYLISKESEPKVIPMIYDYWGNSDPTSEETPHEDQTESDDHSQHLRIESAAYVLITRAVPNCIEVVKVEGAKIPSPRSIDEERLESISAAILFYGLYCKLLEQENGPEPKEAIGRAFARLEAEPELDLNFVKEIRQDYEVMLSYKIFRSNATILEFIGERAWHLAFPDEEMQEDARYSPYFELLINESYGKLVGWTLN